MMTNEDSQRYLVVFEGMSTAARLLGSLRVPSPHGLVFQTATGRIVAVDLSNGSDELQLPDGFAARFLPLPGSGLVIGHDDLTLFRQVAGDVNYVVHPIDVGEPDVDVA